MIKEKLRTAPSGWFALGVLVPLLVFTVLVFIRGLAQQDVTVILFSSFLMTAAIICLVGLFMVEPNQGRVLLLFGKYMGTVREPGLRWANPFYTKKPVSLRQAGAIIAARTRIVEGAVGMVEMALEKLSSQRIIDLDEDRKASMVSNLLVVLCGDRATQPVVNTGTIYQ